MPFSFDTDDAEDKQSAEYAQKAFADLLLDAWFSGAATAKHTCLLAWWATKAGARGLCEDLAKAPGDPSTGNYSKHLQRKLGLQEYHDHIYKLDVRQAVRFELDPVVQPLAVVPPHEAIIEEYCADPDVAGRPPVGTEPWASALANHPVSASGDKVLPLCIYLDGVQYAKRSSILCICVFSLLTGVRHLCCVLRKDRLCGCGCHGWCSLWPILRFLTWSIESLAKGIYPSAGPWGQPLTDADGLRVSLAGKKMPVRAAVVQVRGDWAEFSNTLGLSSWKSTLDPCFLCSAEKDCLHDLSGLTANRLPWREHTTEDYRTAVGDCEIWVTASPGNLQLIADSLQRNGRVLFQDIPSLGLVHGDCLTNSDDLPNIGDVAAARPGAKICFWRPTQQSIASKNNPLFYPTTHIGLDTICIDVLHTLNLGVVMRYVNRVFWCLLDANPWGVPEALAHEFLHKKVSRLRVDLFAWYRRRRVSFPAEQLTELNKLTPKMLGKVGGNIATKGAETKWLLAFCVDELRIFIDELEHGRAYLDGAEALWQHLQLISTSSGAVTATERQVLTMLMCWISDRLRARSDTVSDSSFLFS